MKTSITSWLVIAFLHIFVLSIASQTHIPRKEIALFVNNEPITKEEFSFFAQRNRYLVIREFRNKLGLDYHSNFWSDKSKGISPSEVLRKMTIDTLVSVKVQLLMAKKYGIIRDASFQSIRMNMETENKRRTEAIAKKIKFYGPEQFDMNSYFDYFYSNMVIKLKDYLVTNEIIKLDSLSFEKFPSQKLRKHHSESEKEIINRQINMRYNAIVDSLKNGARIKKRHLN